MSFRHAKIILLITLLLLLAVPALAVVTPGRITVYSTPSGANACVDNTNCDFTTATFTASGNAWHTVVVTAAGYQQWSDAVYVTSDQTSVVNAILEVNSAVTGVQVYVTPGSGTICIDNSQCRMNVGSIDTTGSTQFTGVTEGYHTITVDSTDGYNDYSKQVYVTMGKFTTIHIDLDSYSTPVTTVTTILPAFGTVRVYVDRLGSTVCLDNADCRDYVGGSPGTGTGTTLFEGVSANTRHTITVAADGYWPYSREILVTKDLVNTVDVSLQPFATVTTPPTTLTTTASPTSVPTLPTPLPTQAGLDAVPLLGAFALCGAAVVFRNHRK
jgi:hypothetical protein